MDLRLIVIGCGWAGKLHAEAIRRHPRAELVAIVDQDIMKAGNLSREFGGISIFNSMESLLQSSIRFDGGVVCTLPATHISLSRQLIQQGKHVLCEKPMGREPEHIVELISLLLKSPIKVGVNCNQRFAPTLQRLRQYIESDEKVHLITASMHQNGPTVKSALNHDYLLLSDACCHMIDSLRFLNGEIETVHAFGQRIDSEIISDVTVNLQFQNGSIGSMTHTYVGSQLRPGQHPFQHVDLSTDRARYTVDNLVDGLTIYPHKELYSSSWSPSVFEARDYSMTMTLSVTAWIDCILNNSDVPVDLVDAYRNAKVVEACMASIESGQAVRVNDV